jgi:hypothetical protein
MTLQLLPSEFPYILGKFDFLFYQCRVFKSNGLLIPEKMFRDVSFQGHFVMKIRSSAML